MEPSPGSPHVFRFGLFEIDLKGVELRKSGVRQKLAGQPFQVLQILLEHPQQIVTREELRQRLWPQNTFVDYDLALKKAINRIREALGDSAENPRFIETVPRLGYRFIAPVNANGRDPLPPTPRASSEARSVGWKLRISIGFGLGSVALLGAVLGLMPARQWRKPPGRPAASSIRSLAVLPLQSLSADPTQEYFSQGMTDALITDLAQINSLKVISRTSSMEYSQARKSLPQIARELAVDGIVEGTVQRSGDRVRITAQLIQGSTDKHLWAGSYERDLRDMFALEREVSEDISAQIRAQLVTPSVSPVASPQPSNLAALEAYLQGNYHLSRFAKGTGDEEKAKASEYFQRAIDADPSFAPAYNGLAQAHLGLAWPSSQDAKIAEESVNRAVALDPRLSDAYATLGDIKSCSWDFAGSEEQYRRAIALNPNNAHAHDSLATLLDERGRLDEGWKERQLAQELDPNNDHISDGLERRGQYDAAIAMLQMMLKRYPDDAYLHVGLFREYLRKRMYKQASFQADQTVIFFGVPEIAAEAQRARAISGNRGAIRETVKGLERLMNERQAFLPVNIAEIYSALGDKERAFYWLEKAYVQHDRSIASTDLGLERLNMEYLLDPLRSDPRFKDLLRRVGLPERPTSDQERAATTSTASQ